MRILMLLCAGAVACSSAEAQYRTALVRCVDQAATGEQADACKRDVDKTFRVYGDAGDGAR